MYNFIDGDYFESLSDFSFGDMHSTNFKQPSFQILKDVFDRFEKPCLFIETHRLPNLFKELNGFPDCKIIAHNSDATYGEDMLPHVPKNVISLWCQNYNYIENDVVKSLPIGLERVRWFPEQRKQELLYNKISEGIVRDKLVYMNFNPETNPLRKQIYESLKDKDFITVEMVGNGGNYENYLNNLKRHKYVISPPGNGIDCHRNWEAIYCGCIPIVLDSYFTRNIYKDLPVSLTTNYDKFNNINVDMDNTKSYVDFWEKIIK
jgi:hypothetical protein